MFLSSGNRDLGVAFKVPLGSQALSRVEAKNSALILSCDGYLLDPIEWPKGVKPPWSFERGLGIAFSALKKKKGLISR